MTPDVLKRPPLWKLLAAYACVYVIWGSTYLAIRFSVETIPPLLSGGVRFLAAGAILLICRLAKSREIPSLKSWTLAFRASLLPFVVTYGLITKAETVVPSSIAGLIVAVEPLLFCLFGWLFFNGKKPLPRHYAALAVGFAGIFSLIAGDPRSELSFSSEYTVWMFMIFASCFAWVFGAFVSADARIHKDALTSSGMQMLCGGAVMLIAQYAVSFATGVYPRFDAFSLRSALAVAYLVIFGSLVAYTSFLWLMRVEPANRVSTHAFVNPVVAVLLGWLFAGEEIYPAMLISGALVVSSVVLMIWEPRGK